MSGLLNIGLTGLNTSQHQLNTTSHNIANAATPGFTRQSTVQSNNQPFYTGSGYFGQGVQTVTVSRQYDQFLESQVLAADNRRAEFSTYSAQISQLSNLFADPQVGLSPMLGNFFAAMQEVANNPSVIPARQSLISAAQAMTSRFNMIAERVDEIRSGVESEIVSTVDSINTIARQIVELNQRISIATGGRANSQPNDLLDQRDNALSELNRLVKAKGVIDPKTGEMSVFIGSGQSLVLGQTALRLGVTPDPADPGRNNIVLESSGVQTLIPERLLGGGALGGLLGFRSESLDPSQDRLNLIARQVTQQVNQQHHLGADLENMLGGDFFRNTMVRAEGASVNPPAITITNDSLLTNDRYRLVYDGAAPPAQGYTLTNLLSGDVVNAADVGLSVNVPAGAVAGHSFIIEPLRNAARDMAVLIRDPGRIAAGAPVSIEARSVNTGSGRVEQFEMNSSAGLSSPVSFAAFSVVYDEATDSLMIDPPPPAGPTLSDLSYDPGLHSLGKRFEVSLPNPSGMTTFSFTLSGVPSNGDRFSFSPNTDAPSDNRNMVALGALQTARVMMNRADGTASATFTSAYSQVVAQVGNKAHEVSVSELAQANMLRQAQDSRDAFSGVNLDEEAANLIRYQQAYQASGRVMAIAQRLFDEVLSIAR